MQNLRRMLKQPMSLAMPASAPSSMPMSLRDGGGMPYRKGYADGGKVVGPGTGISDSVPARYSAGEYVLPADTAAHVGYDKLDAIKDATHTPSAVQRGLRNGANHDQETRGSGYEGRDHAGETLGRQTSVLGAHHMGGSTGSHGRGPSLRLADDGMPSYADFYDAKNAQAAQPKSMPGANPNVGPNGSAEAQAFRAGPQAGPTAAPEVPSQNFAQRAASAFRDPLVKAGTAAGNSVNAVTGAIEDAGAAAGKFVKGAVGPALRTGSNFLGALPHAAAYADDSVPFTDKLRIGATDLVRGLGAGAGSIALGAAGGVIAPGVGAFPGAVAGGLAGDYLGHKAGNFLAGGDEALRRNNYDPDRNLVDSAKDAVAGKSVNAILGGQGPQAGAGRGSINPTMPAGAQSTAEGGGATADGQTASPNDPYAAANAAKIAAANSAAPPSNVPGADATMPGQDPGRGPMLRGMGGMDMGNGVSKFTQDGKTLYSNVAGPDNDKLMSGGAGVSTVPGMSRDQIAAELGGRSADQTFGDNAIRAANLRDGVDINRGVGGNGPTSSVIGDGGGYGLLSKEYQAKRANDMAMGDVNNQSRTLRGQTLAYMGQQAENASRLAIAASGDATTRRGQDITGRVADAGNRLTARGQDITERDNMRTNDTSLRNNKMNNDFNARKFGVEQGNWQKTYDAGRNDAANAQDIAAGAAKDKALQDFTSQARQSHTTNVDGKSEVDETSANQTVAGAQTMLANQIQALQRSGSPDDLARAANLQKNGIQAMGPDVRQKIIAATKLANKVNASGSNYNPLKPDFLGTSDPSHMMNMKRNADGDYVTGNGKVIPKRFMDVEDAGAISGRLGGVPTNEYSVLKAK